MKQHFRLGWVSMDRENRHEEILTRQSDGRWEGLQLLQQRIHQSDALAGRSQRPVS